jgi:ribosomal-protein-alanine N-acetyltransferase
MPIRPLHEDDFLSVLALEQAAQLLPWSKEVFEKCNATKFPAWVLEESGLVVGFIYITLMAGDCHILNLSVAPTQQRKGYGTELLRFILAWAGQHKAIMAYLEVRRSNLAAIQLYQKFEFNQIGERKNYYQVDGMKEDALVFAIDLSL